MFNLADGNYLQVQCQMRRENLTDAVKTRCIRPAPVDCIAGQNGGGEAIILCLVGALYSKDYSP